MSTLHDPEVVRAEYATEAGLLARRAAYRHATGPNAPEMVFQAVAEVHPRRYVEVGCGPGELARVGDVQDLAFSDGEFDCAVAAWMLYHVRDVPRALGELARVLHPGGRLVAVTNGLDHLKELRDLLGLGQRLDTTFSRENGEELLRRHFARVELRDAAGAVTFPDRDAALAYVRASITIFEGRDGLPDFEGSLVVRRSPVIFVAEK